jgi:hypothetical protein
VQEDVAVAEELDALPPELDCAGFGAGRGHGVFSRSKYKKESNGE